MNQVRQLKRVFNTPMVLVVCMMILCALGYSGQSMAAEEMISIDGAREGEQEHDISSRGIRGQKPQSSISRSRVMNKTVPSRQISSTASQQQIQALQKQVNDLQGQMNALRAVIQVSNGVATVQSKVIRLQGESVTLKSVKDGVTIQSKKALRLESNKDMSIKANSQVQIHAGSSLNMKGNGTTHIQGVTIKLNNGTKPIASLESHVVSGPVGGPGKVTSGSPTVMVP